jgi:hypothetical protein
MDVPYSFLPWEWDRYLPRSKKVQDLDWKTCEAKVKQDLWEKLKVPEKEFVEAYKNMISITQNLNIILQSASIAKGGSIRIITTYPSSF